MQMLSLNVMLTSPLGMDPDAHDDAFQKDWQGLFVGGGAGGRGQPLAGQLVE